MSLATLKRKTRETYKTKRGTFSLNGHRRNISYVGKNYAAMKSNLCNCDNSTNIKKSVLSTRDVLRRKKEPVTTDVSYLVDCDNKPRGGTIQNICNNWVQRVEPDGNLSQGEYIKNKHLEATTGENEQIIDSDNGSECFSRIGGKYYATTRYHHEDPVMTSGEYNEKAVANRGSICPEPKGGFQKPFPPIHNAGDNNCRAQHFKQALDLINYNKTNPGYYHNACTGNCG
tara:strand:+ start:279 stop:965 length:687 start_codon:yes stop_codon:yes gene_type:complete